MWLFFPLFVLLLDPPAVACSPRRFTQDKTSVINDWISKLETALLPLLHKQFGLVKGRLAGCGLSFAVDGVCVAAQPYFETMYALGCYEEAVVLAVKNALKTGTVQRNSCIPRTHLSSTDLFFPSMASV